MTTHLYSASLLSAAFPLREGALDVHPATMWPDPLVPANGAFSPRALPTFLPFGHAMATHGLRARGLFCCDGTGLALELLELSAEPLRRSFDQRIIVRS